MIKLFDGDQLLLDFGESRSVHVRDPHSITEQSGFMTPEQQISRMMAAGVNLQDFRREMYDFPDGNVPDDALPDPTQKLGFDLADASELLKVVSKGSRPAKQPEPSIEGSGEKSTVSPETVEDK